MNELRDRKGEWAIPNSCYKAAAKMLEGTLAAGTAATMKNSYERVQNDMRPMRYYIPNKKLG